MTTPHSDTEAIVAHIRAEVQRRKLDLLNRPARPDAQEIVEPVYRWGDRLSFGVGGSGVSLLRDGWSQPEAQFTWSDGSSASLELRIAPIATDMLLSIEAWAFTCADRPAQRVLVSIDDHLIGEWSIGASGKYSTLLLRGPFSGKRNIHVQFSFPDSLSPASVGLGADGRQLGIALSMLSIEPIPN